MTKPFATALALFACAAALGGCDGADFTINGQKGVPLSEIELAGPPPSEVFLASDDTVILSEGDRLAITVEGAGTESLRFVRDKQLIGITREDGWKGDSKATIRIAMPAPAELVIGGSGTIRAPALASEADINIGGSGTVEFGRFEGRSLGINIGGSGTVTGAGTAKELEIVIGGSGKIAMPGLKADRAAITIGGSGDIAFASDGTVEANIGGAGNVRVRGNAKCTVNAMGSGKLTCTPTSSAASATTGELPAPVAKAAE